MEFKEMSLRNKAREFHSLTNEEKDEVFKEMGERGYNSISEVLKNE